ncbi:MAG: hypothetical protein UU67_C0079G0002 [Candidatus Daviesbacteria bacterium GW2011_GWB1_41_5]|uniref:Uncharacterized protein n=1 Tax=Candidatus Daviesbacteria bacterium GW2011_GWB1_41_5 TaxID=1618429 RepID=A0A0G0WE83_9BACT|nr:MAG: hypothetical protein UU67_C0079G0002 [Candidatus Daviesbacteria bacterium GW2011_GWB1_41_5]
MSMSIINVKNLRKFVDLALALDRLRLQEIIREIQKTIISKGAYFNHKLSPEQWEQYQEWVELTELIQAKTFQEEKTLVDIREKILKWQNPKVTFRDLISRELVKINFPKPCIKHFIEPIKKTILGKPIEENDYRPKRYLFKKFGKYNTIKRDRKLYWLYQTQRPYKGYGAIAKEAGLPAKTVESAIKSYKQKLTIGF